VVCDEITSQEQRTFTWKTWRRCRVEETHRPLRIEAVLRALQ
jgi:hypothetical protein